MSMDCNHRVETAQLRFNKITHKTMHLCFLKNNTKKQLYCTNTEGNMGGHMAVHVMEVLGMLVACRLRVPALQCGQLIANQTFVCDGRGVSRKWQEKPGTTFHS